MNLMATCPKCGLQLLVQAVACVRCKRTVSPGEYMIMPPGSRYTGQPVCFRCADGEQAARKPKAGPEEVKA